jgi:hypothetical protein
MAAPAPDGGIPGPFLPPMRRGGSPLEWVRGRRDERAQRRTEAKVQRVTQRVATLGAQWRVLDLDPGDPDFIAIGPGGIFQVSVFDAGRAKVLLAGDVVQIDGKRPPYVAVARQEAARIADGFSRLAGRRIPVIPVVAIVGTGEIVYYGQPPNGCVVTSYRDIPQALNAHGSRLKPNTIEKLWRLADQLYSWMNPDLPDQPAYRWYPDGEGRPDKRPKQS